MMDQSPIAEPHGNAELGAGDGQVFTGDVGESSIDYGVCDEYWHGGHRAEVRRRPGPQWSYLRQGSEQSRLQEIRNTIGSKMRYANTTRDAVPTMWIRLLLPSLLFVSAVGVTACGSKGTNTPAAKQAESGSEPAQSLPQTEPATEQAQQVAAQPAPPASGSALEPAALDELLAPIALYSDTLLAQVLAAAAYPQEVMDGGNWLLQNTNLQGQPLQEAAKQAGFGPPMQALVMFPTVVDMMCQNFDWTKQLGSAFNADQGAVMASVQRLRAQAAAVGNLKSTPQQKVETQTVDKQQVIVIQPADPKVIYVPTYNPQVVYTTPPPPAPVAGPTTGDVVAAGLIGFTAGVIVGSMFNNNNYYPYPNWGYGGVWYGGNPYNRNVYVYAPRYGHGYPPGYRPGYGYRPPANYPNGWNRPSTLPAYSSGNYYNRFNGNQNLRPGNSPPPLVSNNVSNRAGAYRPPNYGNTTTVGRGNNTNSGNNVTINNNFNNSNRPAGTGGAGRAGSGATAPSWKGQQQYQGARPGTSNARPGPDRGVGGGSNGAQSGRTASMPARPATPAAGSASPAVRPASPAARPNIGTGGARTATDRGFGGASSGAQSSRAGAASARPTAPMGRPANPPSGAGRETAFAGASAGRGRTGAGAQQDRAAANRGQASVGKGGTRPMPGNQQRGARK
jgi:hypothetical protein